MRSLAASCAALTLFVVVSSGCSSEPNGDTDMAGGVGGSMGGVAGVGGTITGGSGGVLGGGSSGASGGAGGVSGAGSAGLGGAGAGAGAGGAQAGAAGGIGSLGGTSGRGGPAGAAGVAGSETGGAGAEGGAAGDSSAGSGGEGNQGGATSGAGGISAGGAAGEGSGGDAASAGAASSGGSGATGSLGTANLFTTIAGKTQAEVDDKVRTAVQRFFGIGTGESATPVVASGYRCYYELPQDSSLAFIWAADSNDIRSEGMSYGMMIAVQANLQTQFDRLWKFSKAYMQYPSNTGTTAWKHYFRWQGTVNTSSSPWVVSFGGTTVPAPDGDEYFAAALYLADRRWGSEGNVDYKLEADGIASAMLHNASTADSRHPIIHPSQNMVVFVPYGNANGFSDPSYHLPGFYEIFALYGPSGDAARWRSVAETSRSYLVSSAHASTGLHSDYATFTGTPTTASAGDRHDEFRYDAWRVVMNMAVDHAWFSKDPGLQAQIEKYHAFFASHVGVDNVSNALFRVDGTGASGGGSTALTATLAAGALASGASNRAMYVSNLWNVPQQSGTYRYYQQGVYLLGLLAVSGQLNFDF